ncbi:MAG: peroxide stress protein YaaA, partial [Myxococcales bacterium]|nr:peroxide stress protein YaaA [Myxococcales bacterium]
WGDRVTDAIVQDSGGAAIVNLASEEYFKAVRPERLQGRLVTPVFHEIKDGNARVIGFSAKRARGMMARFIIDGRLTDPEGMKEFAEAGYRYQPKESDESRWIFSRRAP